MNGKLKSLGVKGKRNEAAAWEAFQKLVAAAAEPTTPASETVSSAFDAFLSACRLSLKPKTVERYGYDAGEFVKTQPDLPLSAVTPDHVRKWLSRLEVGSTSRAIMLASLSAFFGWCVKEDRMVTNPVRKVTRPRTTSRSAAALISEENHQKLLAGASPEFREVLLILHATGCRPGEVLQITAESFHPEARAVVMQVHKTDRTEKPRVVFVTPEIAALITDKIKLHPTGPLFWSNKKVPWSGRSITEAMTNLKRKVGVNTIAYGYRHTYVTDGLKSGLSNAVVASLVGHTSTAVIDKFYSHLGSAGDVLREALKFREQQNEKPPTTGAEGEGDQVS